MWRGLTMALLLCLSPLVWAQGKEADEAARAALARQILDVSFKPQMLERMVVVVDQQMQESLGRQLPKLFDAAIESLEDDERLTEAQATTARSKVPTLVERYRREELPKLSVRLRDAFKGVDLKKITYEAGVPFYAEQFSAEELRQVLAFQSSAVGQKLIDRSPVLMGRVLPALQVELGKLAGAVARQIADPAVFENYILSTK